MKKLAVCVLSALLIAASMAACAEQQYCSIGELKEQVMIRWPEGWHETIETKWRTVEINAPVFIPDVDKMPVLAFRHSQLESDFSLLQGDWTLYYPEDYKKTGTVSVGWENHEPTPDGYSKWERTSEHEYGAVDFSRRFSEYGGRTLEEIKNELLSVVELLNHGRLTWDLEHPLDVMINTATDKKSKTSQISYVHFTYQPTFEGIPGLYDISYYLKYDLPVKKDKVAFSHLMIGLGPYGEMSVYYSPLEYRRLVDDIPLMNFEKVQDTLRQEVEAGHIRKILEMRLGYAMVYLAGDPGGYTGASHAIWHVDAWWCSNGKKEVRPEDPDYPSGDYGRLECVRIAIDAQTGEIIGMGGDSAPDQKKIKGIGEYQGVIQWEEVRN